MNYTPSMEKLNWQTLETLRSLFLDDSEGARRKDYWSSEETLNLYDQTFAQRIGWKWQAVLKELSAKSQVPKTPSILDWGCGTGIAARTFLSHFKDEISPTHVYFYDRSAKASRFAMQKTASEYPNIKVQAWDTSASPTILLLSHVLNEVDEKTLGEIKQLISKAALTIWVEPGTHAISHKLIALREEFRAIKQILAPCPHQNRCPMTGTENAHHWCHNFAEPPSEVFHSAFWGSFSRGLKIDLRSLATSFLILSEQKIPLTVEGDRILGRAKRLKAHLEFILCTQDGKIEETRFQKRTDAKKFKELSDTEFYSVI